MGRYTNLALVLDPYASALMAAPNLLLVPLFFGMFGTGIETEILVVSMNSVVVVATMSKSGLATMSREYVDMARVFGASEPQIFLRILLPGALPTVMAGIQLGLGHAVRALIGAEMLIGSLGLGVLIRQYGYRFDAASVYGILVVLVVLALAAHAAMHVVDRRVNRWAA
jgi:NitT/TauT family transport system permease protein